MGIFSSIFKKNKLNSEILSLVNLQDSIIMPPNTFFENTKNKKIYEQYYQEYKEILSSKKTILSIHLKDIETDDIRVYIDILTNLELHIHDILDNPNKEEYNTDYINNILTRLNTYSLLLNSIEEESFLRLAALSSLKSNLFLSRNKKNAIDNEISRLQIQIFNTQKINNLIKLQLNSCLNIIQNLKLEANEDFIKDLNNRLSKYLQAFNIDANEEKIIYKQVKLEKHLFKSKNILTDLNEEFENLLNNSKLNRENRINQINILINKYMAIKEYKRIENQELFYNLVEYKVNSYEIDYNIYQEIIGDLASYLEEKEIIKEIFLKKVNNFFQNPNVYQKYKEFNKSINPFTFSKIANLIKTLLKTDNNLFDYDYVISNPILIGLIYSINRPIELCNYFSNFISNFKVSEKDYENITILSKPNITWQDKIPIETLIRLIDFIISQNITLNLENKLIYNLYLLYNELTDKKFITKKELNDLYEGIKELNLNRDKIDFNNPLINYIDKMFGKKIITFPSSTKSIKLVYDYFIGNQSLFFYLVLNEGLTDLTILKNKTIYLGQIDKLDIPSSVKKLKININTQNLNFINYPESSLLNDQETLKDFFKTIITNQNNIAIKTINFIDKNSMLTFSIDLEKIFLDLNKNNSYHHDLTDKLLKKFNIEFTECITKKYNKLYNLAKSFNLEVSRKPPTLENLAELNNYMNSEITKDIHRYYMDISLDAQWYLIYPEKEDFAKSVMIKNINLLNNAINKCYYLLDYNLVDPEIKQRDFINQKLKLIIRRKHDLINRLGDFYKEPIINEDTRDYEKEYCYILVNQILADIYKDNDDNNARKKEDLILLIDSFGIKKEEVLLKYPVILDICRLFQNRKNINESFDSKLCSILLNHYINYEDIKSILPEPHLVKWQPKISIMTILDYIHNNLDDLNVFRQVYYFIDNDPLNLCINIYFNFKPFLKKVFNQKANVVYHPRITYPEMTSIAAKDKAFYEKIEAKKIHSIQFPPNMKSIDLEYDEAFKDKHGKKDIPLDITLPNAIIKASLGNLSVYNLNIPPTLQTLKINTDFSSLYFEHFTNSMLLNDKQSLRNLISFSIKKIYMNPDILNSKYLYLSTNSSTKEQFTIDLQFAIDLKNYIYHFYNFNNNTNYNYNEADLETRKIIKNFCLKHHDEIVEYISQVIEDYISTNKDKRLIRKKEVKTNETI